MSLSQSQIQYISTIATNLDKYSTFVIDGNRYLVVRQDVNFTGIDDIGEVTVETDYCSFIDLDHSENWVYGDTHCIIHGGALIKTKKYSDLMGRDAFNETMHELLPMLDSSELGNLLNDLANDNMADMYEEYIKQEPWEHNKFLHSRNR